MLNKSQVYAVSAAALIVLSCASPNNPYQDRKNTNISSVELSPVPQGESSRRVGDTLTVTADLFVAQYIDSMTISYGTYWDTVIANNGSWTSNQSVSIRHVLDSAGSTVIKVTIYVDDGRMLVSPTSPFDVLGLPPMIKSDLPATMTIGEGQQFSLHVTVSGSGPFSYVWTKDGDTISTAASSSLTIANVSMADSGTYRCVVHSAWGTARSDSSVVSITPAGTIPAPGQFHIIAKTDSSVTLRWTSVDSVEGYKVHRANVDTFGHSQVVTTVAVSSAVDMIDLKTASYFYWVTAYRGTHESAPSNSVSTKDSISLIVYKPRWLHDTMHVTTSEGAALSLSLRDSCADSNANAILAVSIPADTVLHARISGDTLLMLSAGRHDSGSYAMPVVVSDGTAKDTGVVRIMVQATRFTLTKTTPTNGTISVSPNQATFRYGDTATVTAAPAQGYEFSGWSGTLAGKPATTAIAMFSDTTVGATFMLIPACTNLTAGVSVNQAIKQASSANPRNTVFCLENQAKYESNTIQCLGRVQIAVQ